MKAGPRPGIPSWGATVFPEAQVLYRHFLAATPGAGTESRDRDANWRVVADEMYTPFTPLGI